MVSTHTLATRTKAEAWGRENGPGPQRCANRVRVQDREGQVCAARSVEGMRGRGRKIPNSQQSPGVGENPFTWLVLCEAENVTETGYFSLPVTT